MFRKGVIFGGRGGDVIGEKHKGFQGIDCQFLKGNDGYTGVSSLNYSCIFLYMCDVSLLRTNLKM